MTLGVVLSVPDTGRIRQDQAREYHALHLDAPRFRPIVEAMQKGVADRVFALQLHGMAHYMPVTLLKAAKTQAEVRAWLTEDGVPDAIQLPSELQSRWTDGSVLPSRDLDPARVRDLAEEEAWAFREIFGILPEVAVPPTFVWTQEVEEGWVGAGVHYVVTPGRRYHGRDAQGRPVLTGPVLRNGQPGQARGIHYLVRNNYFEPSYGHKAEKAASEAHRQSRLGRPTLFETHRFNFNGAAEECQSALDELGEAIGLILQREPDTRFLSSAELAAVMVENNPQWIMRGLAGRMSCLARRARAEMPLIRRAFPLHD